MDTRVQVRWLVFSLVGTVLGCGMEASPATGSAAGLTGGDVAASETGATTDSAADASSGAQWYAGDGAVGDTASPDFTAVYKADAADLPWYGADAAPDAGAAENAGDTDTSAADSAPASDVPAAPPVADDVDEATQQVWTQLSEAAQFAQVTIGNGQKLELIDLRVTVQVEGLRVRTLVDHIYMNPVAQVAQGKFRYSLPPDASVSYYAMFTGQPDVTPQFFGPKSKLTGQDDETLAALPPEEVALNPDPSQWGALKEGKIAEGVKATIAYETEINKKIDPALGEYVGPNTFEAKVYPIQPNGYNRVLIAYEQTLPRIGEALRYTFPLPKGDATNGLAKSIAGTCEFVVVAKKAAVQKATYKGQIEGVDGKDGKAAFIAKYVFKGTTPGGMLAWDFTPAQGSPAADVISGTDPTQNKAYTLVRIQPALADLAAKKTYAKQAVFLIDTSRSENQRFGTSMKLLDAILAESPGLGQFAVVTFDAGARWLKPAWIVNDAAGRQSVKDALDGVLLEGATDFSAALRALAKPPFQPGADKQLDVFVLSDGDLNWGDVTLSSMLGRFVAESPWQARFFSYRLGIGGDNTALYQALAQGGGAVFNCEASKLGPCATAHHAAGMLVQNVQLIADAGSAAAVADLVVSGRQATLFPGASLTLAARVVQPGAAKVVVEGVVPGAGAKTVELPVTLQPNGTLAARAWAEIAVAQLLDAHDEKLDHYALALSQHFRIASEIASYLVLENESTYAVYKIADQTAQLKNQEVAVLVKAALDVAGKAWTSWHQIADVFAKFKSTSKLVDVEGGKLYAALKALVPATELQLPESTLQVPLWFAPQSAAAYVALTKNANTSVFDPKPWTDEAEKRRSNGFVGAAVRALSTAVELRPQHAETARLTGHRLQAWDQGEMAAGLFLGVLKKRPFEPQSYRDLAGSVSTSRPVLAALLYEAVLAGNWDSKFLSLKQVVKEEYALHIQAAQATQKPVVAEFLKQRHQVLGLQTPKGVLRVTITWNTDQTDVDLWVTNPLGEKCFYSHKTLSTGGQLLDDLTQGYGPERFEAQKVVPGKYLIQAHYYANNGVDYGGETWVNAVIMTHIGTPQQDVQQSNVLLKQKGDVATLGEVWFK